MKKHSRRYQKIKQEIKDKNFSLVEGLQFITKYNKGQHKGLRVSFTLNWNKQKLVLKKKIIFPNRVLAIKDKIAIVKDDLPDNIIKDLLVNESQKSQIELITSENLQKRLLDHNGKVRKKTQWKFISLLAHPKSIENISSLESKLTSKGIYPTIKNGCLTENIITKVKSILQGEQLIKNDKDGNFNCVFGENSLSQEQLIENYNFLHKEIADLRPSNWKGNFIQSAVISGTMSPGIKIHQ